MGKITRLPVAVPTLADLQNDPALFDTLPLALQDALYEQAVVLEGRLRAKVLVRHRGHERAQMMSEIVGRDDAAKRLGTTVGSLHKKHKRLRLGYIDPLDGRLKFTAAELEKYIQRQRQHRS